MEIVDDFLMVFTDASRISLTFIFVFLCLLYWYSVYPFSVLSRCGIKHPKPVPFFGNMFMFREGFFNPLIDIIKTHGRVCGYYLGRRPMVLIADPDMLRQVLVRDFNNFPNRVFHFTTKPMKHSLLMLRDDRWKRVRSIVTSTFNADSLKEMVPLINTAADALMNNLKFHAASGEAFNIHKCCGCFTMDVIASVAFGVHVDSQNDTNNFFIQYTKMFFAISLFRPLLLFSIAFPSVMAFVAKLIPNLRRNQMDDFFIKHVQKILKQSEERPPDQRRGDFIQLMLDIRTGQEHTTNRCVKFDNGSSRTSASLHPEESPMACPQKEKMTDEEIVGQAFVFLLAGYETSSNTLAFICYLLGLHPECQQKIQKETDDFFRRHDSPDYTNIQELKYLDMVVCEALRLYPPLFRFTREVDHDCVVNNHVLPKGATLEIHTGFLHRDPEFWPEPEKFIPERFTPEAKAGRHPFVYLPFGAGPRSCVGMRLAQLEIRMALVHLFHRFNITACSETKVPLDLKSFTTLGPKSGIFVKITQRNRGEVLTDN